MEKGDRMSASIQNRMVATFLLLVAMVTGITMSWVASPAPFLETISRSVPFMVMIFVLCAITLAGATIVSRIIGVIYFLSSSIIYFAFFFMPEWGVSHLFIGLTIASDIGITVAGCKSPMVSNANDNFLVILVLFIGGFVIGFFFEVLNSFVIRWWTIETMFTYPMISVFGINLIVAFTYAFIGLLLFETCTLSSILVRKIIQGNDATCNLN